MRWIVERRPAATDSVSTALPGGFSILLASFPIQSNPEAYEVYVWPNLGVSGVSKSNIVVPI